MKTILLFSLFSFFSSALYAKSFAQWKKEYAKRTSKHGLPQKFTLKMLSDVVPDPEIVKKDRNQITSSKKADYQVFIKRWLRKNPSRIEVGRKMLKENLPLLKKIEKKYGVQKEVIVALWGVETFYGRITGNYSLVQSLATLAYDGRRRKFFETQLNAALRLIKQGHVTKEKLKGSWAGATGNCQFMPSNIPVYAVDFDGDGKKDIWSTKADIFASIANYLKKVGWKKGKSIGSLAINSKKKNISDRYYRTKSEYNKLGFRNLDGSLIKKGVWRKRKLAKIPLKNSPVVLRGSNYKPLLRWNGSSLFAAFNILLVDGFQE